MTLESKLVIALARSTAQNPISTASLAKGHTLRATKAALADLLDKFKVCHCRITKNGTTIDWWWTAGNIEQHQGRGLRPRTNKPVKFVEDEGEWLDNK